ncbi:MAG TPA: rhodanese-like domain-containing protein [Candidatus Sulfotelmatobacter sp.]|nr:rhodanese-like domain-containing protein [Candidatus Sulfotelmatobacter sp.]
MNARRWCHYALLLSAVALASITQCLGQASSIPASSLLNPEDLVKILQTGKQKPLLLHVGSHVLYSEAHIPGSEYVGAGSTAYGVQQLQQRVKPLPKSKFIVLYCGCCPWNHCPNVKPAYDALAAMGFTNVKVLYISNNFGANWVDKGYPTARGE